MPLRKETKRRLETIKGTRTFDDLVQTLLDRLDEAELRAPLTPERRKLRDPEEQVALARLAARRWRLAVERGRIREIGPRLVAWRSEETGTEERLDVKWRSGRGFPP